VRKTKLLLIALLCSAIALAYNGISSSTSKKILDDATDEVKLDLKETTKKLKEVVDYTTSSGKLSLFKALRGKRSSRKTIKTTTNRVEQKINDAIKTIEQKDSKKYPVIREKTGTFITATKKDAYAMHKKMVGKMRKLIGVRQVEVVRKKANKAKSKINKFEKSLLVKIATLKKELRHDLER